MDITTVHGIDSWKLASDKVVAHVTETGGHLAPVTFDLGDGSVQPFMVAPWAEEELSPDTEEVLRLLRGDFFCMPFGDKFMEPDGLNYPMHGESATRKWTAQGVERTGNKVELRASMDWTVKPGRIEKLIRLVDGQTAVYSRHTVTGIDGAYSYGMHPTLQLPDEVGCAFISQAPFEVGEVCPFVFERPDQKGYQSLRVGALFQNLNSVPGMDGSTADLTRYPARKGYEDFVMMKTKPELPFGWAAVSVPSRGYVWISLKDPRVLPLSLIWMSNGGRYYAPWNGRNIGVIGMEEAALNLPLGPAETALQNMAECPVLRADRPLVVNTIMAVASIGGGFGRVVDIRKTGGGVKVTSDTGMHVDVPLELDFLTKA
jgi:hypothetical protein